MRAGVLTFPGSNCDRDLAQGFKLAGADVEMVWHKETSLPKGLDVIGIPGGFSFGDYLRCGAKVLCETGLLPGALMRNAGLTFVCRQQELIVESRASAYTSGYEEGARITVPIAHHDGNYSADEELVARLRGEGRVAFSYVDNPNGSAGDIAGVLSENRRVLGMMPHPERAMEGVHGNTDGAALFASLINEMADA